MACNNYNLFFLVLILFTTDIRSENDLYNYILSKKLRKSYLNNRINKMFLIMFYFSANILRTCHRSDPNLNDCIKQAIEDLRPYIAKGKLLFFCSRYIIHNIIHIYCTQLY